MPALLCLAAAALSSVVGKGILGLLEAPATYRLYHYRRCGTQASICAQCDCGNRYCPGELPGAGSPGICAPRRRSLPAPPAEPIDMLKDNGAIGSRSDKR